MGGGAYYRLLIAVEQPCFIFFSVFVNLSTQMERGERMNDHRYPNTTE